MKGGHPLDLLELLMEMELGEVSFGHSIYGELKAMAQSTLPAGGEVFIKGL